MNARGFLDRHAAPVLLASLAAIAVLTLLPMVIR